MTGQPGRSGGPRQGTQGKAYAQRTDLMQKQRTPEQIAPSPAGPASSPGEGAPLAPSVPLGAPTQRPGEHIMSGVAQGPGPGPMQAGLVPAGAQGDGTIEALRAIYAAYPNADLAKLLEAVDGGDYATGGLHGHPIA